MSSSPLLQQQQQQPTVERFWKNPGIKMKSFTILSLALIGLVALGECSGLNRSQVTPSASEMWIRDIEHGVSSFHGNPADYRVFRNVMDFGCKGDGIQDDTACINTAISSGARCGLNCGSSTIHPGLIYFPSGTYKISSPIIMYYYSQLIGNANDPPTLLAAPEFEGMAMIDSNPYDNTGNNWYTNQNNFFRQVRNFVLDTTQSPSHKTTTGVHWQVAQATSLVNLHFKMTPGSNHQGIWMENGSGGFMSDLKFEGGKFGMWVGNQQFLSLRMTFDQCDTAIFINWNWQWSFKSITIRNSRVGIDMSQPGGGEGSVRGGVGSVLLMDSEISDTQTAVLINSAPLPTSDDTSNTLLLDNVRLVNTPAAVATLTGETMLAGGTKTIQTFGRGSRYSKGDTSGRPQYVMSEIPEVSKDSSLLDAQGRFFEKSRPQYENLGVTDFVSVKAQGAKGDGRTDDTDAIQRVINENVNGKVVYFPAGTYLLSRTVKIPSGTRMIGEVWSTLMAAGSLFQDQNRPAPMLQVGDVGETGSVEISDFMFSTKGAQPGAILLQWNLKGSTPGAAMMHDAHFRVGGFQGSELQVPQCPKGQSAVAQCFGAHTLLHLTASASAYMENVWAWTGDHDLDNHIAQGQISIYTGRGVLIESNPGPVWLYGIQSEHNVLYQYQLNNAKNIYMTMIQSETPYWQPGPPAPQPFNPDLGGPFDDPGYGHCGGRPQCEMSYSINAKNSENIYLYGGGMYNFFYDYDQTCLQTESCQDSMINIEENNRNFYMFNANTKAAVNMVVRGNTQILARQADNKNGFCQSINAFLVES